MIISIVSGSPDSNLLLVKQFPHDFIIGVDFGAYKLIESGIKPDIAIGDFDSINEVDLARLKAICEVLIYPAKKNETDTELAISYALGLNPTEINLFGATGKRLDHFFGAFYLFKQTLLKSVKLNIIDDYNKLTVFKPGTYSIKKNHYKYISFFAFSSEVRNLTLSHFKYPLENHLLNNENTLCLSNEIINEAGIVSFDEGNLLIVESND